MTTTNVAKANTEFRDDRTIEHGVECACYAGGPGEPYYRPSIECICGWGTGR